MPPKSPTRSGLLPEARRLVLPKGIVASEFPKYRETCRSIGVTFDDWQVDLNRCVLGKLANDLYAADTVGLSIGRQVGKTFDIGAIEFADCIIYPGTTVVWTAHRFKVARETFNELRALAKSPKLSAHLEYDDITTAAGNETIPFRNGSRIVFAARERGAIRGFTKVRKLILDEAQILTEAALSDLAPTMNQAVNPQIIMMGTPPKPTDPSEVWTRLRADALEGTSEGTLWVEIGAEPGSDPDDRAAWRQANPSYPHRTPARAIQRLRKLLSVEDFCREALGIWDATGSSALPGWADCADATSAIAGRPVLAVSMTPDRSTMSLVAAGRRPDDLLHVETVLHGSAGQWFVDKTVEIAKRQGAQVAFVTTHPAGSMAADLEKAGVRLLPLTSSDYTRACGAFYDDVIARRLHYLAPQPELDAAVGRATRKAVGEAWRWAGNDISALVAATQAAHAARTAPVGGKGRAIALA